VTSCEEFPAMPQVPEECFEFPPRVECAFLGPMQRPYRRQERTRARPRRAGSSGERWSRIGLSGATGGPRAF
jgi:hypothetical protein